MKRSVKRKNPKIYKSPLNELGRPYWVPIVTKSKDTLVGFIEGAHAAGSISGIGIIDWSVLLSSERFCDVTTQDLRLSEMTKREKKEYIKSILLDGAMKSSSRDFAGDILSEYYFNVSCLCGGFLGFHSSLEIPDKDLRCNLCNRVIIQYTKKDDDFFEYDGLDDSIDTYLEQAKEELGMIDKTFEGSDEEDE